LNGTPNLFVSLLFKCCLNLSPTSPNIVHDGEL